MTLSKCRWFNDHQSPCSLMIDDLVPAAVSLDGTLGPHNDWGYLLDGPDSLFSHFQGKLLAKYPQIKGTFFLPLASQYSIPEGEGYTVFRRETDEKFVEFTRSFAAAFELAFHGIRHTYLEAGRWVYEFADPGVEDLVQAGQQVAAAVDMGIQFSGGKFPGYKFNQKAIAFARDMGFKWLALDAAMINREHPGNELGYIQGSGMVNVPTNISGAIFGPKPGRAGSLKKAVKRLLRPGTNAAPEKYLEHLVAHGHPISIQEHFQNQRTDGRRQTPNVYDDMLSLDLLFNWLRPLDIWYAKCSEIAHYYDSYMNTEIIEKSNGEFEIRYGGGWNEMFLSFTADVPCLKGSASKEAITGVARNGRYVFPRLPEGTYSACQ